MLDKLKSQNYVYFAVIFSYDMVSTSKGIILLLSFTPEEAEQGKERQLSS